MILRLKTFFRKKSEKLLLKGAYIEEAISTRNIKVKDKRKKLFKKHQQAPHI